MASILDGLLSIAKKWIGKTGPAGHRRVGLVEEQPLRVWRRQANHALERRDRVDEFRLAVAVEPEDHLQDRDGVLQVDCLTVGGGLGAELEQLVDQGMWIQANDLAEA
jgi:hypothetical protein